MPMIALYLKTQALLTVTRMVARPVKRRGEVVARWVAGSLSAKEVT